jgi:hypothetical protein
MIIAQKEIGETQQEQNQKILRTVEDYQKWLKDFGFNEFGHDWFEVYDVTVDGRPWAELEETLWFLINLHGLTVDDNPRTLRKAAAKLAEGRQ